MLPGEVRRVLSALLMFRRVAEAFRFAVAEEEFLSVVSAALTLLLIGTVTYALGEGWRLGYAFVAVRSEDSSA